MAIHHAEEFRDQVFSSTLSKKIHSISKKKLRLMEVCGTHTMAISKYGIRSLLPESITMVSGPGCPVCVTAQSEIDAFISMSEQDHVIIATFGDLIRVPGSGSSLREKQAQGCDVRIIYSTLDAVEIAKQNPDKTIVFPGVGFETTTPGTAAAIISADRLGLNNFCVYSAHKIVPPALFALMKVPDVTIDGFLLPGHVSVIIGTNAYKQFADQYKIPCVIAGFEPADILMGIFQLTEKNELDAPTLDNIYKRAVTPEGNVKAQKVMASVFETTDAEWRGLGVIPDSGLQLKNKYIQYDASERFDIKPAGEPSVSGCICGEILTGKKGPSDCKRFGSTCTPITPFGPCMVSSEGTCAAFYKYL